MTMYHLISTKGSRTVTGLAQAIAAAKAMDAELQPSYGVTVEDDGGDTVAEVDEASVVIDGSMLDDLRSEAEAAGDGEGAGERLVRSGAPGLARLGMVEILDRLDLHERADVGDHVLPALVDVLVNPCLELLVRHDGLPACDACGNAFHGSRGGRAILAEAGPLSVCGPSRA